MMPFLPVLLPTDAMLWGLVVVIVLLARQARRSDRADAWRAVFQRPVGMATGLVLAVFVLIALADSLHFRPALPGDRAQYAVQVESVLDLALTPLRYGVETTYSAPLAAYSLGMQSHTLPGGKVIRSHPRLRFGGAQLQDPATERLADLGKRAVLGLLAGLLLTGGVGSVLTLRLARRQHLTWRQAWQQIRQGQAGYPARTVLLTVGLMLVIGGVVAAWAAAYHVLGTDKVGQDVLYATLKSVRTGLVIGTLTTLVTLPFALALGIMAGYFQGRVDDIIQYIYTTLNSIPGVLLIAAAVLILQVKIDEHPDLFPTVAQRADIRLLCLCVILGLTSWTGLCRLLRAETLKLRDQDFVQAAIGFGLKPIAILVRHILPNVLHLVLISVTLDFSGLVLSEAVLSYIGVGVDPSSYSWGNMINAARLELAREPLVWWNLAAAFTFMFALVLCANLFADAIQQAFDPRSKETS